MTAAGHTMPLVVKYGAGAWAGGTYTMALPTCAPGHLPCHQPYTRSPGPWSLRRRKKRARSPTW